MALPLAACAEACQRWESLARATGASSAPRFSAPCRPCSSSLVDTSCQLSSQPAKWHFKETATGNAKPSRRERTSKEDGKLREYSRAGNINFLNCHLSLPPSVFRMCSSRHRESASVGRACSLPCRVKSVKSLRVQPVTCSFMLQCAARRLHQESGSARDHGELSLYGGNTYSGDCFIGSIVCN